MRKKKKGLDRPDAAWLKNSDLQPEQIIGFTNMVEKFPQYTFTQEITPQTLERLQQSCEIDMDDLEQKHGNDVSENGELGVTEEWALNKAFYTELLGFPLLLWDRRINLKPSPYKRIFKRIHELAKDHRLKALRVKTFYMERKKRLGCADMYNETSTKRMQWQNEMVKNLKENAIQLKEETGALLGEMKKKYYQLDDFMKGDQRSLNKSTFKSRFNRFKSQGKSRSKSRRGMENNAGSRRRGSIAVGMTQQEYNAAFDRMFRKKATRESINATRDREAQKMNIEKKYTSLQMISRTVDLLEAQYVMGKPPYSTHPRLMLEYVALHTDLQASKKMQKVFKHFFLQPLTQILFEKMYWYIFCKYFQPNSEAEQEDLFKAISAQYVSMIGSLNKKNRFPVYGEIFFMTFHKDVVFRIFPFAIARTVVVALKCLCNGSNPLFNSAFSKHVYADVYHILYGVPACDASIRHARKALFDKPTGDFSWNDATDLVTNNTTMPTSDANPNNKRVVLPSIPAGSPVASSGKKNKAYRLRQNRVRFGANMISPLVREHMHTKRNQRSGSVDINITRTEPVLWCRSGGMDNYHKNPSRKHVYRALFRTFKSADAKHKSETRKTRMEHNKLVKVIENNLKQKLKQTSDIGRYCLDLMIEKQKKPATESDLLEGFVYEEEDEDEETPEDGTDDKVVDRTGVGAGKDSDPRKDGAADLAETK